MGVQTDIYLYESSRAPKPKEAKYYYKVTCKGQYRWGVGRLPEGETKHQLVMRTAIAAFQRLVRPAIVTVHTDCGYLATYHKYASQWKQNGWKKANGEPVRNAQLWGQLLKLEAMHTVRYQYHRVMPNEDEV